MINKMLFGLIIVIVIVFLYKTYMNSYSTESFKHHYIKPKHHSWYNLENTKPYDSHNLTCENCESTECNCGAKTNKAKDLIQNQKNKSMKKRTGGEGLYNKIKKGNNLPEKQMAAHITSASKTPGLTDEDPGDFTNYMTKLSVNPDIINSHKNYVSESKMFSQQPAVPSDVIEANYGNWWGLGRRTFKAPTPDALLQYGANDEDYDTNWSMKFG